MDAFCILPSKREVRLKRIIFIDPDIVAGLENLPAKPDPELVAEVDKALEQLEPRLRDIIRMRYYNGVTPREIADALSKSENEILGLIYEARRRTKILLADFVKRRWGIECGTSCRICVHPQRETIEKILMSKNDWESWRRITAEISNAVGEKFHPPQILKAHLRHMDSTGEK